MTSPLLIPDLLSLAERVEALAGPDVHVDDAIGWAIGEWTNLGGFWREHKVTGKRESFQWRPAPTYTASIDAAMTLVPAGWSIAIYSATDNTPARTALSAMPRHHVGNNGASMELATVAAALRARAS